MVNVARLSKNCCQICFTIDFAFILTENVNFEKWHQKNDNSFD